MLLRYIMLQVLRLTYPIAAVTAVPAVAPGSMSLHLTGPNYEASPFPSPDPDSYLFQSSILKWGVPSPVE